VHQQPEVNALSALLLLLLLLHLWLPPTANCAGDLQMAARTTTVYNRRLG
jgi:hypothetical protein